MPQLSARRSTLKIALELCLLCLVAVTALAYPIDLGDYRLDAIFTYWGKRPGFNQLLPWISGGFSPLVLKESLLLTFIIPLLFIFTWIKVRGLWLGSEKSAFAETNTLQQWLAKPEIWAIAFLIYTAASVAWSEVFQQSLQTWVLLAATVGLGLVIRSELGGPKFTVRFMALIVVCGILIAGFALLQHLDLAGILPRNNDPRNRMSSLIGHNTGMSSWLLFPLSYALYFYLVNRRLWVRAAAGLAIALIITVIIAAQSRAIWVLAGLMLVGMPLLIQKRFHRRPRLKGFLIGMLLISAAVAALSVSPQTNRLARLPVSLEQRLKNDIFNLDQLRRETRLRIAAVSLTTLVPRAPLAGSGLGSFAWEYPKAQGEYFQEHPDSILGTTTRRTDLAHNDYLQLLVETGIIGLLLLAGLIWSLLYRLNSVRASLDSPWDSSRWLALVVPVLAVALHALVDFPFHITPIACVAVASLCLATRLDAIETPAQLHARHRVVMPFLTTLLLFAWAPWAWQALVGRVLVSDFYYTTGVHWLDRFQQEEGQDPPRQLATLDRARRAFRESIITNVFNGEAYEGLATVFVNRAGIQFAHLAEIEAATDSSTSTQIIKTAIHNDAEAAINYSETQLRAGGLRYHYTWYLIGRAFRLEWEMERQQGGHLESSKTYAQAIENLRKALSYNPADSTTLRELSDLLLQNPDTAVEGRALQQRLFHLDPWAADELILQPAIRRARLGETDTARNMLAPFFEEMANDPRVLAARAWLAYYDAVWPPPALDVPARRDEYLQWRRQKLESGWDAVSGLPAEGYFAPVKQRLELLYAAAARDLPRAHELAASALHKNMWDREARAIFYWTDKELNGGALKFEDTPVYYRTHALLSLYFMDDPSAGMNLAEYAGRAGLTREQKITLYEARRVVAFCLANNGWAELGKFLPFLELQFPGDAAIARAAQQLARHSQL